MKRVFSFFCALCLLVCCVIPANAIMGTYDQAVDWVKGKIGTSVDFDGQNGAKCEDLIYAYYEYLGQAPKVNGQYGKASDYITNAIPSSWERISANITPKPGDIAVYKTNLTSGGTQITGANGHVGVVTKVTSGTFSLVHQNYNSSGKCEEKSGVPVSYLACVIRPAFSEVSAQPGIICFWNPYAEKHSIGSTNAVLAGIGQANAKPDRISRCGIYLYNKNGNLLTSKTETPKVSDISGCYLWFDVNDDLGYILSPGTTYQYKLCMVINGEIHYSPMYSFTTGAHTHTYVNGYCKGCGILSFPDVKQLTWYYGAVQFCASAGYITGHGTGNFAPFDGITRQDFVLILSRIAKENGLYNEANYTGQTSFTDVKRDAYYAKAIQWATKTGIITGYNATKFGVGDKLTREQLVTILYRYADKLGVDVTITTGDDLRKSYPDFNAHNPNLTKNVEWALQVGLISGKQVNGKTCIAPALSATRAEVAQILLNIHTKSIIPGI